MSKKPQVLGKFVYIELPDAPDSKIIVDENTKEELHKKMLVHLQRVKIWAVGDAANPKLKVGQEVLVNPSALTGANAKLVPFPDEGKGVRRALVLDYDIVHIWP